jgi:hypothetical protein
MSFAPTSTITTIPAVDPESTTRAMQTAQMYDLNMVDPMPVVYNVGESTQTSFKRYYFKNKTTNAPLTVVVDYPSYLNIGYPRTKISDTQIQSTITVDALRDVYITFVPDAVEAKERSTQSQQSLTSKIYFTVTPPADVNPIYIPQITSTVT